MVKIPYHQNDVNVEIDWKNINSNLWSLHTLRTWNMPEMIVQLQPKINWIGNEFVEMLENLSKNGKSLMKDMSDLNKAHYIFTWMLELSCDLYNSCKLSEPANRSLWKIQQAFEPKSDHCIHSYCINSKAWGRSQKSLLMVSFQRLSKVRNKCKFMEID